MIEVLYRGDTYTFNLSRELFLELKRNNPELPFSIRDKNDGKKLVKLKFLTVKEKEGK